MQISLPYGHSHIAVDLDDDRATVLKPRRGSPDPIRLALTAPIDSLPLRELVHPGQSVVILTSDITRPCPTHLMLPPVLDELTCAGIRLEDVLVVFALGTHRSHKPEEQAKLLGETYGKVRCVDSDPHQVTNVGTTSRGTPIEVFEPVVKADVRIALGNIEYHYFAGYSGGAKALVPGVCSGKTVQHNHAMMVQQGAYLGNLDGNPVRADIEEGTALIGLDFILNVIVDEGRVTLAAAGDPVKAHRWACRALDYLSMVQVDHRADIVLVSAGGYPKDINMYQAQKALDNAMAAVRPGGIIIWVAECGEGLGNATFEKWMIGSNPDETLRRIQEQFVVGGHKAAAIARVQKHASIWLVSQLATDTVRACGFVPYSSVEQAIKDARKQLGQNARMTVLPEGASVVPQVA